MPKFFVSRDNIDGDFITISEDNANHILNVLRYEKGDEILVCDGQNNDYKCIIERDDINNLVLKVIEKTHNENEPKVKIVLFQGLPKSDKMEMIIQKCIEIGVSGFVPVQTDNTVVKLKDKEDKKIQRWNKIAESASKQCGRGIIPQVDNSMSFKEAVKYANDNFDKVLIPYECEREDNIKKEIKNFEGKNIAVFIGPEGGFSPKEIEYAIENGVKPVTLGNRILRTETAGIVASTIILYELGDLG